MLTNAQCRVTESQLLEDQICAGGQGGTEPLGPCTVGIYTGDIMTYNIITCQGDTGGPLTVDSGGQQVLAGVTSYNSGEPGNCAQVIIS